MFALAEKKRTIVTEAMSRGNQEDCQKYGKIVSEFADFFEIRREKKMALEQILDKYVYRDDVDHPSTPFEYNGRTIYILDVDMNFDQTLHVPSGIRWEYEDLILHYRVPSMPYGGVAYLKQPGDGDCSALAETLMFQLENERMCALCGYILPYTFGPQKLCLTCASLEQEPCPTCGLTCGGRRATMNANLYEHREGKRRRTGGKFC